ncbi:MAG TPA: hypothetical protein VHX38_33395 [Pseudonocardiaceae bacterium]|jgi:hypothetical protein|nr:hypothetical protein [Pseudonocardiaceae bacterium]
MPPDHDHEHSSAGAHRHPPGPRHAAPEDGRSDTLVLDIGGDIGALSITTGADRNELEIEISPVGADPKIRTHNVVHARQVGSAVVYAAVFPSVKAGDYTVWHDESTPAGRVTILGGHVTEYRLS